MSTEDAMGQRGIKRARPLLATDSSKPRGPYALRACTSCRRRKCKCDGHQPCGYCHTRGQLCIYVNESIPLQHPAQQPQQVSQHQAQRQVFHNDPLSHNRCPLLAIPDDPVSLGDDFSRPRSTRASLTGEATSLRSKLNNARSMIEMIDKPNSNTDSAAWKGLDLDEELRSDDQLKAMPKTPGPAKDRDGLEPNTTSPAFYGPTSPDYSMNLVRTKLRERGHLAPLHRRQMLPSLKGKSTVSCTTHWQPERHCDRHQLLQFRSWLTLQDARDVLSTYHEVVGVLHPFVDFEHMKTQLDLWYSYDSSRSVGRNDEVDDDDLIILVLILAIAAHAQVDTVHAKMAFVMHSSFQHAANATVTSGTASIKQATIVLLLGYYYFTYDLPQLALRMCGTAGRILLELGFHNSDTLNQVLRSESRHKAACIMMSTVIVLDRQWSAMTGLPANFPNATFNPTSTLVSILAPIILRTGGEIFNSCKIFVQLDAPYTNAMHKLILISDRFNEPITLAAEGGGYADDDAVELLVFQIQQWQRNVVGGRTLRDMLSCFSEQSAVPPAWELLVVFRAASIRSLLLRPYFFPTSHIQRSKQHLLPALELASDVTGALTSLDCTTSIYRNHRPYYQHILSSICALLFLVAAHVEEHRQAIHQYLPPDYDDQIIRYFQSARKLTEKYADVSKGANTLWRRIQELCRAMEASGSQHSSSAPPQPSFTLVGTSLTHQQAEESPTFIDPQKESTTAVEKTPFEFDPCSFGASLDIDISIEDDSGLLQDSQVWGLSDWPSNLQSYLFQ
ncbi:hypothetical protein Asppvi_005971 [Aspergillus pseudoviridinutans]|uniref:Zn(2)-C6 fungal-type domain-containing protein n=1 Tax=Aspergillus pseudoviridinutans TaxID=1517512 RepID=A0A9P3ET82_9EURO|nr:uncharacterized protein Asppvi_005971 [Aspergillus pseudoviridinutans]GIJ87069.1 hypothetical protein Asppvi_005971 [Aspergillus pseudoviridinutans]